MRSYFRRVAQFFGPAKMDPDLELDLVSLMDKNLALRVAALDGKTDKVRDLLDAGANVHSHNDAALITAAGHGYTETVKALLAGGADVHANHEHALLHAIKGGHTETVRLLLQSGANVHVSDDLPLFMAVNDNNTEIAAVLLLAGADFRSPEFRFLTVTRQDETARLLREWMTDSSALASSPAPKPPGYIH
jgi:ankyrin repeat protein